MSQKGKYIKRLKTISLFGMSQLLSVFSVLILSYIIIQFHSIELWGEYVEILIWTNVFLLFLSFGNNDYLLKLFSKNPSKINQQWTNNLIARSILLPPSLLLILFILKIFVHQSWQAKLIQRLKPSDILTIERLRLKAVYL